MTLTREDVALAECVGWSVTGALTLAWPALAPIGALLAVGRLLSLGAEGALLAFLAGQPLIFTLLMSSGRDPSVLLLTCTLATLALIGAWGRLRRPTLEPALLLWAVIGIALAWLRLLPVSGGVPTERFGLLGAQLLVGALLAGHYAHRSIDGPRSIVAAAVAGFGCAALLAAGDYPLFHRGPVFPILDIGRTSGVAAVVLVVAAIRPFRAGRAALLAGLAAATLTLSVATLTRQGVWAFVAAVAVVGIVATTLGSRRTIAVVALAALALLATGLLFGASVGVDPDLLERISTSRLLDRPATAFDTRAWLYESAFDLFRSRPLFGWGFGGFGDQLGDWTLYPHNVVLEVLVDFGVAGLAFCLLPMLLAPCRRRESGPAPREQQAHLLGVVGLTVYWFGISSASYSLPHSCFVFYGLFLVAVSWRRIRRRSREASP